MFMNVGYTPPPPVWPPKKKTGMGLYLPQNFATPQRLIAPLTSAQIQIPSGWGMGLYQPQNFATPQRLIAPLDSAAIQVSAGWGMGCGGDTNCSCGCSGKTAGMGLFDSGTDFSGWGVPEWSIVGIGAAAALSLLTNVANTGKSIRRAVRRRKSS